MTTITISATCRQGGKKRGLIRETVVAQRAVGDYRRCVLVPGEFYYPRCDDEAHARFLIGRVQRVIAFMDATGLKAHRSWGTTFPGGKPTAYADHVLFWRDRDKRVLVTTEPYGPWSEAEIYSRTPEGW